MSESEFTNPPIYLDHAASSWPKPPTVSAAVCRCLEQTGANPGRSGHRLSLAAARIVFAAREAVAAFFGVPESQNVIFTANATHALNLAIHGLLRPGDHVITTAMEHNSVMRPLTALGCEVTRVEDCAALTAAFRKNTRLVVAQHGSNVNGRLTPIREFGAICRARAVPLLVDAAQTAGTVPINVVTDHIDLLAFTGHKALLGPQGTGGLCLNTATLPQPLYRGGSGSRSEEERHPEFLPDRLEAGTPNTPGIAGLHAGIEWLNATGCEVIAQHERGLREQLVQGLQGIRGVRVFSGALPVVSFVMDGLSPSLIAERLDYDHGILSRVGLHCAPAAHRLLGTFPTGTVRLSLGYTNTPADVAAAIQAVTRIASAR